VTERSYSRRDTVLFVGCVVLSVVALFAPRSWGEGIGGGLRRSILAPLVWLQTRAEEGKTGRARLRSVTTQRDSLAYVVQFLPALQAENERLRRLLELSRRVGMPFLAAEVLHQTQATDGRVLMLSVGEQDGVAEFNPVVAPEGLIGVVVDVSPRTSVVMTWANPEFRVSAFALNARASGIVAPAVAGDGVLEFRGVPYRDSIADGTPVLSSGLGGVYPKGIPIGTVAGVAREQEGWERVYRLRPAADPASTSHVLVLTSTRGRDLAAAFPSDSQPPNVPDSLPSRDTLDTSRGGP
jgi:rod shape-determining protein MreC